jgi:hypothetical protein
MGSGSVTGARPEMDVMGVGVALSLGEGTRHRSRGRQGQRNLRRCVIP